jgi:hypothetical protein
VKGPPDQMKSYAARQSEGKRRHIAFLEERDAACVKDIPLVREWLEWLTTGFVPGLRREAKQQGVMFSIEKEKIAYLRQEFELYLKRARHSLLVRHYRDSRRWQPRSLELALLRHEEMRLLPNYLAFIGAADEAVRSVAAFLLRNYSSLIKEKAGFFEKQFALTGVYYRKLRQRHFGGEKPATGWHTTIEPKTDLSHAGIAWMTYLLME